MKEIKITKKLYDRLRNISWSNDDYEDDCYINQNELYLLGKNKKGIFTEAIEIECDNWEDSGRGCEFMPAADKEQVTQAYVELAKKKLIPAGFGHVTFRCTRALRETAMWSHVYGKDIHRHKGIPFIRFAERVRAFVSINRRVIELSIKVV